MQSLTAYPEKINTICSGVYENVNGGASPYSYLWYGGLKNEYRINFKHSVSRIIIKFDLTWLFNLIREYDLETNLEDVLQSCVLNLKSVHRYDYLFSDEYEFDEIRKRPLGEFEYVTFKINKDWERGGGVDIIFPYNIIDLNKRYVNEDASNWRYAKKNVLWNEPGIITDPFSNNSVEKIIGKTTYNDQDIRIDIKDFVLDWFYGEENNGVCIAINNDVNLEDKDYRNIIAYYTDLTNTAYCPFLEINFSLFVKDERKNLINGKENRIFYVNFKNGELENFIVETNYVNIYRNLNQQPILFNLPILKMLKGVYYFDFNLNINTIEPTVLYLIRRDFNNPTINVTENITLKHQENNIALSNYIFTVYPDNSYIDVEQDGFTFFEVIVSDKRTKEKMNVFLDIFYTLKIKDDYVLKNKNRVNILSYKNDVILFFIVRNKDLKKNKTYYIDLTIKKGLADYSLREVCKIRT